jgi:hypothetical protein
MTTHGLTGLAVAHLPRIRGGDLTRLSWRGWHIDLDEQRVTVPAQPVAGKNIDDLDLLLGAGYRMLTIATAARLILLPQLRDRLPDSMITQIVAVLQSAQRIADRLSQPGIRRLRVHQPGVARRWDVGSVRPTDEKPARCAPPGVGKSRRL